ncbi:unnamed protein product [Anisakis simplex]|uniref:Uncharacterized protein n=1 Tax=Anisakis simplex TaxID=6269 RepID=A0A158PPA6_ANISI|nr:unnamed protein product [Anisakis simplex]
MHPNLFPEPEFDPDAPECIPFREPCGFYSFSLNGGAPLKWVKSWCQCDRDHECAYERTDMKMRVYRHVCIARSNDYHDKHNNDANNHRNLHNNHMLVANTLHD